jgi:hypothetical protein
MARQDITRLFLVLVWVVSAAGGPSVICYGSDGHIAIEPEAHHHIGGGRCGNVATHDESDHPHANCEGRGLPCSDVRLYSSIAPELRDDSWDCTGGGACSLPHFEVHEGGQSYGVCISMVYVGWEAFPPSLESIVLLI